MKGPVWFVAGVLAGTALVHAGQAQDSRARGLNHVGIAARDFDGAVAFYKQTLGFTEAYALKRPDGGPLLTYLQVNNDTFLEITPAGADTPPGLTHFAVEYGDIRTAIARIRQAGVTVADASLTPGKALFTRLRDRDGVSIEVMEFGPESQQRRAMDAWK